MNFLIAAGVAASIFSLIVLLQWVGAKWWPMSHSPEEGATDE